MITLEELIESGYWRKHYHTVREDYIQVHAYGYAKDIKLLKKISGVTGEPVEVLQQRLLAANKVVEAEAITHAGRVVSVALVGLNDLGLSLEEVRQQYAL